MSENMKEVTMKALSMETSILQGEKEVKELVEYVMGNAEKLNAYDMEKEIFLRIMSIGHCAMERYFASNGSGDVGKEFASEDGTELEKESTQRVRNYFSVFGKIKVPQTYYRGGEGYGIMPLDALVDFPERSYSYLLQEWMDVLSIRDSYKESEITLTRLLGLKVSSRCGHTVKDRMEGSGRRWSIKGAESILLLRSIYTSQDWDAYWQSPYKN